MPTLPVELWQKIIRVATFDPPFLDDTHTPFNEDITDDDIINRRPQPSSLAIKRILILVNWTWYHLAMQMLWETLIIDSPDRARQILFSLLALNRASGGVNIFSGRFVRKILCLQDNSIEPDIIPAQFTILVSEVIRCCPNLAVFASRGFEHPSVLRPIMDSLGSTPKQSLRKVDFGTWLTWNPSQWNLTLELMGLTSIRTLVVPLASFGVLDDNLEPLMPFILSDKHLFADLRTLVITPRIFLSLCTCVEQAIPQLTDIHLFDVDISSPRTSFFLTRMQAISRRSDLEDAVYSLRFKEHRLYTTSHFNACFQLLNFFPHLSELYIELFEIHTYPGQLSLSQSYHPSLNCIVVNLSRGTLQKLVELPYGISNSVRPELRPMVQLGRTLQLTVSFNLPALCTIRLLGCSQAVLMPQSKETTEYLKSKGINLRWT